MHILYLVPHVPNPTKVRSYFHVRGLSEAGHRVTVVTLERSKRDAQLIARLQESGIKVIWSHLSRLQSLLNSLSVLPSQLPLQSAFMWSAELMSKIEAVLRDDPPDVIHVEHLRMARFGLRLVKDWTVVWDAVDYLTPLFKQAATISANLPMRLVSRVEAPRLAAYERWLTGQFPLTLIISAYDQALLQKDNPYADSVHVVSPGLDISPLVTAERAEKTLIITGTLNYHPNVASVQYFVTQIFPLIQAQCQGVQLLLVGANPDPVIQSLQSEAVTVTGFVPSVRQKLEHATIALAPVLYAAGMQYKVMEAFLTATPLVATSVALHGLNVHHNEHVLIADTPTDFADCVVRLLNDADLRARIGQAGRLYVEQNHNLLNTTASLVELYNKVRRR